MEKKSTIIKYTFIGIIFFIFIFGSFLMGRNSVSGTNPLSKSIESQKINTAIIPKNSAEKSNTAGSIIPVKLNKVAFNESFKIDSLPKVISLDLDEMKKYTVQFKTEKPIRFVMYSEKRYNEWKSTGSHTLSKITTKSGSNCCSASGTYTIDMNTGEGGKYYFVYDGADIQNPDDLPKSGSLTVSELSTI